ncbi:MAG: outer membrane protein assembly factor BamD [Verrucomicrobiota bacterium]|jgi:outer membrane protein assembly factor BamD (BamD/ComL family)|nr:outer membrane protein assembly factor BamD [Verrucomicrobiota bacterium]MDP7049543.1 outer membrane protein assembly factor BamD [Verrucomicrobiota bacterium]
MQRWTCPLLLVAVIFFSWPNRTPAPIIYRPGEGWSYERIGGGGSWRRTSAKDQLAVAKEAFAAEDWKTAFKAARRMVADWPLSDYAPEAQLLLAQTCEKRGDDERAFSEYRNLLRFYPQQVNFEEVQARQFDIATRFLSGQRYKLWGRIPLYRSMSKTTAMFQNIVNIGPFSAVAPKAQMNIGQAWVKKARGFQISQNERHKNYRYAVEAFSKVADKYHDRPGIAAEGLFAAAAAYEQQSLDAEYDQGVTRKAIDSYSDFIALYPNEEQVPAARERIKAMKVEQARGSLKIARYYEKKGKLAGANVYYNEVKDLAPDTEYAEVALQKIAELQPKLDSARQSGSPPE